MTLQISRGFSHKRCALAIRQSVTQQGFIQDFTLEGGHFFGIVNICMRNRHCVNLALLGGSGGMPPPPPPQKMFEKIAALGLNLVGFGSYSQLPNTCVQNYSILTLVNVYWNKVLR